MENTSHLPSTSLDHHVHSILSAIFINVVVIELYYLMRNQQTIIRWLKYYVYYISIAYHQQYLHNLPPCPATPPPLPPPPPPPHQTHTPPPLYFIYALKKYSMVSCTSPLPVMIILYGALNKLCNCPYNLYNCIRVITFQ